MRTAMLILLVVAGQSMAATFTAITNGVAYLSSEVLSEIRSNAVYASDMAFTTYGASMPPTSVGSYVTEAYDGSTGWSALQFIAAAQRLFEILAEEYISFASANAIDSTAAQEATAIYYPTTMSISNAYAEAGLTNGFRYATVWDPAGGDDWTVLSGGMWTNAGNGFGKMEAGHIVGPWIVDDLQRAFTALNYRWYGGVSLPTDGATVDWYHQGVTNRYRGYGFDTNRTTAINEAIADFKGDGMLNTWPYAVNDVDKVFDDYDTQSSRQTSVLRFDPTGVVTNQPYDIVGYNWAWAGNTTDVFDAQGDANVASNVWSIMWTTNYVAGQDYIESDYLGTIGGSVPTWPSTDEGRVGWVILDEGVLLIADPPYTRP